MLTASGIEEKELHGYADALRRAGYIRTATDQNGQELFRTAADAATRQLMLKNLFDPTSGLKNFVCHWTLERVEPQASLSSHVLMELIANSTHCYGS